MKNIERIEQFITNQSLKVRSFEDQIGCSNGVIRRAIKNKTDIQSKWITAIADNYPQLNLSWLLTGEGSMLKGTGSCTPQPEPPPQAAQAAQDCGAVVTYLEKKLEGKEKELKEAYYEIGRLNALVEQLKKDTN